MPTIFNRASFNGPTHKNQEIKPLAINIEGKLYLPKLDTSSKISSTRYDESLQKQINDVMIT